MYCAKCGAKIADDSKFCTKCGAEIKSPVTNPVSEHNSVRHTGGAKKIVLIALIVGIVIVCLGAVFIVGSSVFVTDIDAVDDIMSDNIVAKETETATETEIAAETVDASPTEVNHQEDDQFVEDDIADSDNVPTVDTTPDLTDESIFDVNVSIDVEAEVAQIREWYYDTQNRLDTFAYSEYGADLGFYFESGYAVKGVVAAGYNDLDYTRQYFYHDQKLYFAFIFKGSEEYRLYFKDGIVVRYIDNFGNIYDYGNTGSGELLADKVVTESDEIYPFN